MPDNLSPPGGRPALPVDSGGSVTLRDVARRAGVSVSTVSLVVNDKAHARVGEGTRQRVEDAVNELGYRTNVLARSLVRGNSPFIGLVADAISTTPFAGKIIRGAQQEAWRHGFVLLVADTDAVPEAADTAIQMMVDHRAHGILYSTWYHREVEPPPALDRMATVFVNCLSLRPGSFSVIPDEVQGGRTAAEALLDRGHRRVAFINAKERSPSTVGRLKGYKEALAKHDIEFDPALVIRSEPEQEGGYAAAGKLLAMRDRPTAVFCYNDRVAMGLYDRLKESGVRIPADMAVVGFDDQEVIAAHLRPALSSVALPHYDIGAQGVRTLLDLVGSATMAPGPQRVHCPLVSRESI
jgi:LacI family transcriptional regulator